MRDDCFSEGCFAACLYPSEINVFEELDDTRSRAADTADADPFVRKRVHAQRLTGGEGYVRFHSVFSAPSPSASEYSLAEKTMQSEDLEM